MENNREAFLETQINLFADIINGLETSKINRKEKKDLQKMKTLYKKYMGEYKTILLEDLKKENSFF